MRRTILVSVLLGLALTAQSQSVIKIGGSNAPPYRVFDTGRPHGIYIDIMNAVAAVIGLRLEYLELPLARALVEMQRGSIDMMLGPNITAERQVFMDFLLEIPFPRENKALYRLPQTADIRTYSELSGKRIGVIRNTVYDPVFDADNRLIKEYLADYPTGFRMLARGRVDVLIIPELQGDYLLRQLAAELNVPIVKSSLIFPGADSYIAISKASAHAKAVLPQLVAAMKKLIADGTVSRIISSYRQ